MIQDESFIKEISDKTLKMMEQNGITPSRPNMPFYLAPTVIVCSAPKVAKFGHDDIACSIMNMMHSAHSYGLGSCYIGIALGIFDSDIQKRFQLPDGIRASGLCSTWIRTRCASTCKIKTDR